MMRPHASASAGVTLAANPLTQPGDVFMGLFKPVVFGFIISTVGCYYGLSDSQRDAYATGATQVAAPGALLLMAGCTKVPGTGIGISEEDLRRRFPGWEIRTSTLVPVEEITHHTRIPIWLKAALKSGVKFRRFELSRAAT